MLGSDQKPMPISNENKEQISIIFKNSTIDTEGTRYRYVDIGSTGWLLEVYVNQPLSQALYYFIALILFTSIIFLIY